MKVYADWLPRITLGQRIHDLRVARHWSVRDVQAKAHVSGSTVSRVERGEDITLSHLVKLSIAFEISLSELLAGVDLSEWER